MEEQTGKGNRMAKSDPILDGSKRFRKFRESLIKTIPRLPDDRTSLNALQSKSHTDLLIIYLCWRLRHVGRRPRNVTGLSVLVGDPRAEPLKRNIDAFTRAVVAGADLDPYISKRSHREGYVLDADPKKTNTATRDDKDHLLNVMGLHHFHLGLRQEASGLMARTDEVLFAHVSRDTIDVLGLIDHSAFEWSADNAIAPERQKLWSICDEYQSAQAGPGAILMSGIGGSGITLAGKPMVVTMKAIRQIELIRKIETELDDPKFTRDVVAEFPVPRKIKPAWHYDHLDFGLQNEATGDFKCLMPGPN